MKKLNYLFALVFIVFTIYSCTDNISKKDRIVVTKTLICYQQSFGYLGSGSIFFDYNTAQKGYMIQRFDGNYVTRTYYCLPEELEFNIQKMKYEYYQGDSIIILPSKNK